MHTSPEAYIELQKTEELISAIQIMTILIFLKAGLPEVYLD